MDGDLTLARRAPLATLFWALIWVSLASTCAMGDLAMVQSDPPLFDPALGGLFWARVAIAVAMGLLALFFAVLTVRILHRWTLGVAGVYVADGRVRFRIPRARAWWHPLLALDEKDVPVASITGTEFRVASRTPLVVETKEGPIEVPPGAFARGAYELDAGLREAIKGAGTAVRPHVPEASWQPSAGKRAVMIVVGLAVIIVPVVLLALSGAGPRAAESASKAFAPFMISGIALLALSLFYRGRVVADARGVFCERSGKTAFVSWDALREGSVIRKTEPISLGAWSTLEIKSKSSFTKSPDCRISIARIFGLGFPLHEIEAAVNDGLARHRRPSAALRT